MDAELKNQILLTAKTKDAHTAQQRIGQYRIHILEQKVLLKAQETNLQILTAQLADVNVSIIQLYYQNWICETYSKFIIIYPTDKVRAH